MQSRKRAQEKQKEIENPAVKKKQKTLIILEPSVSTFDSPFSLN
jgi:hypothetical protein